MAGENKSHGTKSCAKTPPIFGPRQLRYHPLSVVKKICGRRRFSPLVLVDCSDYVAVHHVQEKSKPELNIWCYPVIFLSSSDFIDESMEKYLCTHWLILVFSRIFRTNRETLTKWPDLNIFKSLFANENWYLARLSYKCNNSFIYNFIERDSTRFYEK